MEAQKHSSNLPVNGILYGPQSNQMDGLFWLPWYMTFVSTTGHVAGKLAYIYMVPQTRCSMLATINCSPKSSLQHVKSSWIAVWPSSIRCRLVYTAN